MNPLVKVGTSTITNEEGNVDIRALDHLCRALSGVENLGYDLVLVSSGAIAVGAGNNRDQYLTEPIVSPLIKYF